MVRKAHIEGNCAHIESEKNIAGTPLALFLQKVGISIIIYGITFPYSFSLLSFCAFFVKRKLLLFLICG